MKMIVSWILRVSKIGEVRLIPYRVRVWLWMIYEGGGMFDSWRSLFRKEEP